MWKRLVRFSLLDADEHRLLMHALLIGMAVRASMRWLPLHTSMRLLTALAKWRWRSSLAHERISWAMSLAGRMIPGMTCLPRALSTHVILEQALIPSLLRIGINQGASHPPAHAWVVSDGRVVIGELPDLHLYAPLPAVPLHQLDRIIGFYLLHQRRERCSARANPVC